MKIIKPTRRLIFGLFNILILAFAISCQKQTSGHFQEEVINLAGVNTIYDDYNSTSSVINTAFLFHFSSNRNSTGNDFDIVGSNMSIYWNINKGTINVESFSTNFAVNFLDTMFDSINTPYNELGPNSLWYNKNSISSNDTMIDLMMYANDSKGNFDIKFVYGEFIGSPNYALTNAVSVNDIGFLNTSANELYPTFYGKEFQNNESFGHVNTEEIEKIIYCSDMEGDFDMYEVNISPTSSLIQTLLADIETNPIKLAINSDFEDKCPFVNSSLLVFASNRDGGFGGFDLYYSYFKNGGWSEPINFGDKINSEFDEYRPITVKVKGFSNNLMVFSSNRLGGMGGFDLYYAGIEQLIE